MRKLMVLVLLVVLLLSALPASAATYTTTAAANARSCPQVSCSVVRRLAKNTVIEVLAIVEGDRYNGITQWLQITVNGRTAYVHASLAKVTAGALPPSSTTSGTTGNSTVNTTIPTQAAPQQSAPLSCGTCGTMSSCDQAYACLAAGNGDLDRDKDGIPCESICQ